MRTRLLFLATFFLFSATISFAQVVGTNCFLQGAWVEIGMLGNGSFGTNTAPVGYHTHNGGATWTTGGPLAEVYDYGHDGWSVGTPPLMGDYTYPGTPFEGWEVQINGGRTQGFQQYGAGYGFSGGTMTSTPLTYSNSGGSIRGYWTGTAGGGGSNLNMTMETRVDTFASAVVMTVRFYNTTPTPVNGVYYMRSCDPDNDETWPGGSFTTNNMVNYQNDIDHRVEVTATGMSATLPPLSLATKDCRAVAFIYQSWPLSITQDLGAIWSETYGPAGSGAFYDVGVAHVNDIAIGIVWNLSTIAAGDSAVISYAYVFNGVNGIDFPGAHADPQLVVYGDTITNAPVPDPTYDTFNTCSVPGLLTVPVSIAYSTDKDWTWSKWTWTPSTGLSATTGVSVTVDITALTGPTTYTITGNDSAFCNHKVFILTILPCHTAYNNGPCVGDTLQLYDRGDSVGASYYWYGPGGYTAFVQNPFIYPSTFADDGLYYVIKTIGSINDTDSTNVFIHPLPTLTLTSNIPLCGATQDSLTLSVTPDSTSESFSWTGPNGFSSALEFPVIYGFDSADQGTYTVVGITQRGCKNTESITIYTAPVPGFNYWRNLGCNADTVVFLDTSNNANVYAWDFGDGSPLDFNRNPAPHVYALPHGPHTVKLVTRNAVCADSITEAIDLTHSLQALFSPLPDTFCFNAANPFPDTFINASSANVAAGYPSTSGHNWTSTITANAWRFGDGGTDLNSSPAPHIYTQPGAYPVTLTVTDDVSCEDSMTKYVYVLQMKIKSLNDTLLCLAEPLPVYNTITIIPDIDVHYKYVWTQSSPNLNDTSIQVPSTFGLGNFEDTLTVTIPNVPPDGCPIRDTVTIHSVLGMALTNVTPNSVIQYGSSIQLNADSQVIYKWVPNDGSLNNVGINDPIATPLVTTTYTVYGLDKNGCLDSAYVTIYVDSVMNEGIATGFSPNGDGLNDVFRPVGIKFQKLVEFRVFNRWGQQVFYTNNPDVGWDGTYNGVPQDIGVYFYVIIIARPGGYGDNVVYKGDITLIR